MPTFTFKSSGVTQAQSDATQLAVTPKPIGIRTPLSLGDNDIVATTTNLGIQLTDNLRNLILTNWGERLGFYDFGANLRPLMAELVSQDDFDSEAISRIKDAVTKWMPYVELQEFLSETDRTENKNTAVIRLTITFNIPSINLFQRKLQVTLYAM